MRRYISLILLVFILMTSLAMPSMARSAALPIDYDFDDISQGIGEVLSAKDGIYKTTGNSGERNVYVASDAAGGKRVHMKSAAGRLNFQVMNKNGVTNTLEMGFDMEIGDLNVKRYFGGYDCWHTSSGNDYLMLIHTNGCIYIADGDYEYSDRRVKAGDKLNCTFLLDLDTGHIKAVVKVNGTDWFTKELPTAGAYKHWTGLGTSNVSTWTAGRALETMYFYHESVTSGTTANTYIDNFYLKPISRFYSDDSVSFDFEGYVDNADGNAVPSGFNRVIYNKTLSGSPADSYNTAGSYWEGIFAVDTTRGTSLKAETSRIRKGDNKDAVAAEVVYPLVNTDTLYIETSVLRPQRAAAFHIGAGYNAPYALIDKDGDLSIMKTDTGISLSDKNKWYDIKLAINFAKGCAYAEVYSGNALIGSKLVDGNALVKSAISGLDNTKIKSVYFGLYNYDVVNTNAGDVSAVYFDDIKIGKTEPIYLARDDAGDSFDIAYSTPLTGTMACVGTDVTVVFNKKVNPLSLVASNIKVNGEAIDRSKISIDDEYTLVLSNLLSSESSHYHISLTGIEDMNGAKLNDYIEIDTKKLKPEIELLPIRFKESAGNLKAIAAMEHTGTADLAYTFVFAKYSSLGLLEDFVIEKEVISDCSKVIEASLGFDSSSDYDAFVLKGSDFSLLADSTVAKYGSGSYDYNTAPVGEGISFATGADGNVRASGLKFDSSECGFIVLKPGKTEADIESDAAGSIAYLKYFDGSLTSGACRFPIVGSDGDYTVLYKNDTELGSDSFNYLSQATLDSLLSEINKTSPDWSMVFNLQSSSILGIDRAAYLSLEESYRQKLHTAIITDRSAMSSGEFADLTKFAPVFNEHIVPLSLGNATDVAALKAVADKYKAEIALASDAAYPTYTAISDTAKGEVWTALVNKDYNKVSDFTKSFGENTILAAIANVEYNTEVKTIIENNNSWLLFDMSYYNKLIDKSPVNDAIGGKTYASIALLKKDFEDFSKNPPSKGTGTGNTGSTGSFGGSGGGGGGGGSVSFPGKPAPDTGDTQPVIPPQSDSHKFTDLASVPWAETAIDYMYKNGIINGKTTNSFAPDDTITREEYIKLIVESFFPNETGANISFGDVAKGSWYYSYVSIGVKCGITHGRPDGSFGTGEHISRQDMAVMLARAAKIAEDKSNAGFTDMADVADYAKGYVSALCKMGVINGMGDGSYAPNANATRAQAAVMIYNYLKKGVN